MFERENAPRILTDEQLDTIHEQAIRTLEEIGTDVLHEGARKVLESHGQTVEGERVRWDRGFIEEMVAKAPSSFSLRGRNPERSITIGDGTPVWTNVGGPPFANDLDEGRRSGRIQDHDALVKLTQASDLLTCVQSGAVEAVDLDVTTRHMDMDYSVIRWSDKPYTCYGTSGPKARDAIEMASIVHGGRAAIEETPMIAGVSSAAGRPSRRRPRSWGSSIPTARSSGTSAWPMRSSSGRRRISRSSSRRSCWPGARRP